MRTFTIKEALELDDLNDERYNIYLYRDSEVVLYIGQSSRPFERLREHLGQGDRNLYDPDFVGQLMLNNRPASLTWEVQIATLAELQQLLNLPVRIDKVSLDSMERDLILLYKPCLNRTGNPHRTPLPARYIKESAIANEGVILE